MDDYTMLEPRVQAGAEVIAAASTPTGALPDGQCQVAWLDLNGHTHIYEVVSWRRLDQGPMPAGTEFTVTVQGRAGQDLRLPSFTVTRTCALTLDPRDRAEVCVGDQARPAGWLLGLRMIGVRLQP